MLTLLRIIGEIFSKYVKLKPNIRKININLR
jgi:hypothetical protein